MKKQFSKLLPFLAIAGGIFICSCGDTNTPEGIKSQQEEGDHSGNKDTPDCPTGFTGELCDQCLPDHWGKECAPCNCSGHGTCNAGLTGDGKCQCDKEWEGENCSISKNCPEGFGGKDGKDCNSCLENHYGDLCKICDCKHGECLDGKSGNGQCKTDTCAEGWEGPNCDECADNYATKDCIYKTCKNGTPNLGLDGDGHCSSCDGDWSGTDCDITNSCSHGTPDNGVTGNGQCKNGTCAAGWDGPNCDKCAEGWDGQNCDECAGDLSGAHCNLPKTCKNGIPNLGLDGDGHCSSCDGDWSGTDCDITNSCSHGTANIGVTGNGQCKNGTCDEGWTGPNCDQCDYTKAYGDNCTKYGKVTDKDKNPYKTVIINKLEWMADNYRYKYGSYIHPDNNTENFDDYGLLYNWTTASATGFCPDGWRLPSKPDFSSLVSFVSQKTDYIFKSLITRSDNWKAFPDLGLDTFGFNALPAGNFDKSKINDTSYNTGFGYSGYWWSSTSNENSTTEAYYFYLSNLKNDIKYGSKERYYMSVRCVKDLD